MGKADAVSTRKGTLSGLERDEALKSATTELTLKTCQVHKTKHQVSSQRYHKRQAHRAGEWDYQARPSEVVWSSH